MSNIGDNKSCTRVFKKSSPNGKVTIYIGQRDYLDKFGKVDPIDGVVMADPEYLKDRKLFIHVLASFRYGREDLDVLGLTFRKDLFLDFIQLYPSSYSNKSPSRNVNENQSQTPASLLSLERHENGLENIKQDPPSSGPACASIPSNLTKLQSRLIQKLGSHCAFPFRFELPHHSPASVTLQPSPEDLGKPCGVDYELKAYVANTVEEKSNKRNTVKLAIRKLVFTPMGTKPSPSAEIEKSFHITHGLVKMSASLGKERYNHGECIVASVRISNESKKTIKKVKVQVLQIADIMLFTRAMYKCSVDEEVYRIAIPPGQTNWSKDFTLCPLLSKNRHKRGLALDGKIRYEDTNLASSTIVDDDDNIEDLGIIVSYKVRVRLKFGFDASHLQIELPFTLTHPNPDLMSNEVCKSINTDDEQLISTQNEKIDELKVENYQLVDLEV